MRMKLRTGLEMSKELRQRSMTCVVQMIGKHAIDTVSATLLTRGMSSAEAEVYANSRAAAGTLQTSTSWNMHGVQHKHCSAAQASIRRTGCGRLQPVDTRWLWVEEALRECRFLLKRVVPSTTPLDSATVRI